MNAEQYRALVNKLEAIQEAPELRTPAEIAASKDLLSANDGSTTPGAAAEPRNPNAGLATDAPAEPAAAPAAAPAADPNQIPTIEAPTFSQAYAKAKAQKLKKFKWCGVYAVKDPVRPQPVVPAKTGGIQPAVYVPPIQPGGGIANQNQADTLNLVAAGNMGA